MAHTDHRAPLPPAPAHDGLHLRNLLPSVLAALSVTGPRPIVADSFSFASAQAQPGDGEPGSRIGGEQLLADGGFTNLLGVPEASIAVVLMVDGLGDAQLARYSGHARFLAAARRSMSSSAVLDTGMPTTTAASLASLGTGLSPGQHGLVGYDVLDPERDRVVNMLGSWDPEVDPRQWQPHPSLLTWAADSGARVLTASRPAFEHSALTQAALDGGEFRGATRMDARFTHAIAWIQQQREGAGSLRRGPRPPVLVYLYVDELDKTGHKYGVASEQWLTMLETLDTQAARLCEELRSRFGQQASVLLTADHGMVDVAPDQRFDIAHRPELLHGVRHTAGEPRMVQLHMEHEESHPAHSQALETTRAAWQEEFGDRAWVLTRQEAVDAGWFGTVTPGVRRRIGDLIIAARAPIAIFDTSRTGTKPLAMVGQHGSLTVQERQVPLLELTGGALGTAEALA